MKSLITLLWAILPFSISIANVFFISINLLIGKRLRNDFLIRGSLGKVDREQILLKRRLPQLKCPLFASSLFSFQCPVNQQRKKSNNHVSQYHALRPRAQYN